MGEGRRRDDNESKKLDLNHNFHIMRQGSIIVVAGYFPEIRWFI